ncbi:MAG: glycoside hydrolase family 30 protein [Saprospiraceae bacterium]
MKRLKVFVFETSESGHKMTKLAASPAADAQAAVALLPDEKYQTITGIGGSFTKASATLFKQLSAANQAKILEAYFGDSGARYSLTRTHINSCDFSPYCYTYAPVAGDVQLEHFSIADDLDDLVPMIKAAQKVSTEGFRIIASPWTAPPWMKDNNDWRGGKLLPQYYGVWALFFSKYLDAYRSQGIDIWGITPENEPLGNGNNWESMHFTPYEIADFVQNHLHPLLRQKGHAVKILGFDQNRDEELKKWTDVLFGDETVARRFDGMAVHWYASTFDWFPEALQYVHQKAPDKHLIQTEACVDAQAPRWQDDAWYWAEEATDWGWHWAPEPQKHLHPKYVPVFRYARDIIGCLNNWVDGWIDWNMILDRQGGPNWAQNWCTAPVIVDPARDEVYFTPLYYAMCHFSRFIRPGAARIGFENSDRELMMTAAENPDGSIAAVLFNPTASAKGGKISLRTTSIAFAIGPKAVQTLVIGPDTEGPR